MITLKRMIAVLLCVAAAGLAQDQAAITERLQFLDSLFQASQVQGRLSRTKQQPTADEQARVKDFQTKLQAKIEGLSRSLSPKDSFGITPLTDLGRDKYKGEPGGLYPDGSNSPPAAHARAGNEIVKGISPLDAEGRPDGNGKVVFISIGYSNWTQEFSLFASRAMADPKRNPKVQVIDCALGGISTEIYSHPDAEYYGVVDQRLRDAGVNPKQVQVIMMKVATQGPWLPFPGEARILQDMIQKSVHVLKERFPNLKILYMTSRTYGGYANTPLNPEPHAFETGFAIKWVIADQIAGKPDLNYDPAKGEVRAPWLAWGPYLWADGLRGRKDGLKWESDDFVENDHTHPSSKGREKVVRLIDEFLKTDPIASVWYAR